MIKAYSYARFSSDLQRKGTSIDRQQTMAREWCKINDVELADLFYDQAVSGFDGSNLQGQLGEFISRVESKQIAPGSYLILENLDRLTRMDLWDATALLGRLVPVSVACGHLRRNRLTSLWPGHPKIASAWQID
jgi:DNA invertase Pin-like site-specific DNA recombinase